MTCATCKFLDVRINKAGQRVVRKDSAYQCLCAVSEPILPASVTTAYGYRWPPPKSYMTGDSGENCPCHVSR